MIWRDCRARQRRLAVARLAEYIARKVTAHQELEDKIERIRRSLEPNLKGIKTHLIPVSERFMIGSPMLFRVKLTNLGTTTVNYRNGGVGLAALTVFDEKMQPLRSAPVCGQFLLYEGELASGWSVVLAEKIDLSQSDTITMPGKYFVQFSGAGLEIGQPVPFVGWDPFCERDNEIGAAGGFITVTNQFPSDVIAIQVTAGHKQ